VWEWTLTDFRTEEHEDLYRRATRARAVRGGAWTEHPQHATVTTRVSNDPPKSYYHLGFRVVRG
jgi:formylglycine-generating enzyme required for sulfatase activity